MDLRHARTFVTVAELGTVSKAAQRLRIAQPALSRQISTLERELGIKLFDRIGRRLLLSSDGEQLLDDCRKLLNFSRALGERAQSLRHGDTGTLKMAVTPGLIESVLPDFLHRYAKRYPKVKIQLVDIVGPDMLAMLDRGDIHIAQVLTRSIPPEARHLVNHPLESIDMLAACHPDLKLGKRGTVEVAQLASHTLLQVTREYLVRRMFDATCRMAGFEPNILLESRSPPALLALAEKGHGVAIIPSTLRTHHYRLRIVRLTYRGKPLHESLSMIFDKRRPLLPFAKAFCEMLTEHVREVFPITKPSEPRTGIRRKRTTTR